MCFVGVSPGQMTFMLGSVCFSLCSCFIAMSISSESTFTVGWDETVEDGSFQLPH